MERIPDITPEYLVECSDEELERLYKELVGVDPKHRAFERERLIEGVRDPAGERMRLAAEDKKEDNADLARQNPRWVRRR